MKAPCYFLPAGVHSSGGNLSGRDPEDPPAVIWSLRRVVAKAPLVDGRNLRCHER